MEIEAGGGGRGGGGRYLSPKVGPSQVLNVHWGQRAQFAFHTRLEDGRTGEGEAISGQLGKGWKREEQVGTGWKHGGFKDKL